MKQKLRYNMLTRLKELKQDEKQLIESNLYELLFKQIFWKEAQVIGITFSTPLEWDTVAIMEEAWRNSKTVVLPKCNHINKTMTFIEITDITELTQGHANIFEPKIKPDTITMNKMIDLLIVPGLVFDKHGYRIGFGGGFYDRFLSEPNNYTTTISLAAEFQLKTELSVETHDIPVDYIITEERCIQTSKE